MRRPEPAPPSRVGRFELRTRLGGSSSAAVWSAVDALSGEAAVLKWAARPDEAARARFRAEVASLRGLDLPGVARLLDADESPEAMWLAMAHAPGGAFPGPLPRRWSAIGPCLGRLLGALASVHRLGLVHRDLKPGNVLVDEAGRPTLVDFGLAWRAGDRSDGAGTPRYRAPEQADGDAVDGRADLYALGRMTLEALDADPEVPEEVLAVLAELVAEDPEDRPESAAMAARRLGLDDAERVAALVARAGLGEPASAEQLAALFAGFERVLGLPSAAALALWRRTGGRATAVTETLTAWLAEGLARWDGERVLVARPALDALETWAWPTGEARITGLQAEDAAWLPWIALLRSEARADRLAALRPAEAQELPGALARLTAAGAVQAEGERWWVTGWPPGARARLLPVPRAQASRQVAALLPSGARARHLWTGGSPPEAIADEAAAQAEAALRAGRPADAILALELAIRGDCPLGSSAGAPLVPLWARAALAHGTPAELDRALFELSEAGAPTLLALLAAARRSVSGDGDGALAALDRVPSFDEEELEIWRVAMRVHAANRTRPPRLEAELLALEPWAQGTARRAAAHAGWLGILRYQQERYAEAAELHERSAAGKEIEGARRASWINAANAWLELGALARVEALAERVRESALRSRHAGHLLEAERLGRAAILRGPASGRARPDLELVEVAFSVGRPAWAAHVALDEAALAFRLGESALSAALAERARQGFAREQRTGPALLCAALAISLLPPESASDALLDAVAEVAEPGLAVQAAALLAWRARPGPRRARAEAIVRARRPEIRTPPQVRQEVLSVDEIDAWLIGTTVA